MPRSQRVIQVLLLGVCTEMWGCSDDGVQQHSGTSTSEILHNGSNLVETNIVGDTNNTNNTNNTSDVSDVSDDESSSTQTELVDADPTNGIIDNAAEMYSLAHLPKFHIYLDDDAVETLKIDDEAELKTYRSGSFQFDGHIYENVGVRLKGNLTLTTLKEKPSFKIKFNKFEKGARFLGLESLTLHNFRVDPSMMHEHMSYKVFREAGVPASRTGYAQVYVNDELFGVYLNVETPDDQWLKQNFGDNDGNLYEGEHGDDLDGLTDAWDQDEGSDTSRLDLLELHDIALREDDSLFYGDEAPLDTERVLKFIAGEAYVGHFDGYRTSHNFFLYHDIEDAFWTLSPWSLDQTLVRRSNPFAGNGFTDQKCRNLPNCLVDYIHTGQSLADLVEGLDLKSEADQVLDLIEAAAAEDPRRPYSSGSMESARESVYEWIDERPAEFREKLDCLDEDAEPDKDGDGFGVCFADCDDNNADIRPDQVEICDGIDNDCSGFADDVPECPCPSYEVEGSMFYFCDFKLGWRAARNFCEDQGHELARINNEAENEGVWEIAKGIAKSKWAIGLDDREEELVYRWQDGEVAEFTNWADGEPAQALDWFDCVFYRGSSSPTWKETNCSSEGRFICREKTN